jgi:hypothetical protein
MGIEACITHAVCIISVCCWVDMVVGANEPPEKKDVHKQRARHVCMYVCVEHPA